MASPPLQLHCVTGSHSSHQWGFPLPHRGGVHPIPSHLQLHRRLRLLVGRVPQTSLSVPASPPLNWDRGGGTVAPPSLQPGVIRTPMGLGLCQGVPQP